MIQPLISRAATFFRGLTPRERYAVCIGVAAVLLLFFWKGVAAPLSDKRETLAIQLASRQNDLKQMITLQQEHERMQQAAARAAAGQSGRGGDFTLFSFLDQLAGRAGIKEHIAYMRPSVSGQNSELSVVEMKLEGVDLQGLVSYLHMIETADAMVFVTRLSIAAQEKGGGGGVEAVLRVETVTT